MSETERPLDADERQALFQALVGVSPLSDDDLSGLPAVRRRELQPRETWLVAGGRALDVGFVVRGALREYYVLADGTERTKSFNVGGEFAGSLADLLSGQPSDTWVVAERPTAVLALAWSDYQALVETRPAWTRFAQKIAERLYLAKVRREFELLALDAAQRYQRAVQRWPQLEQQFSQRDIASYIGVTPVHLSRLRAQLQRAA